MKKEDYIRLVTSFFSVVLTIIFAQVGIGAIPLWSIDWFLIQVLRFIAINFVTQTIAKFLFIPPLKQAEVPQTRNVFDEAIIRSKYNFCSTSTKEIALWESSTFLYYLNLNTIKNISEKTSGPSILEFSSQEKHKKAFYDEGQQLLKYYAMGETSQILSKYSAIRILIYPEKIYREKEKEIESLISIHALGRIHCIPVVREKLLNQLNQKEKNTLKELSLKLSQRIADEYTLVSRAERFSLKIKRNHAYECSLPDFLIIDSFARERSSASSIWWYQGTEPKHESYQDSPKLVELAEECFQIIAKKLVSSWDSLKWDKYDSSIFSTVPIISEMEREGDFFSKKYYREWIENIVPEKHPTLKEWINKEEEVLAEIVTKERPKRVLDVGCGWGRHLETLLNEGVEFAAGIDKEPSMILKAKDLYKKYGNNRILLKLEDAGDLSFDDGSFDMVICMTNTFGNMEDETREKAIEEMYRVLKKGGVLVLSVYQDTLDSKKLREKSYLDVGLRPYPTGDPKVIRTQEGLYARQFAYPELENYLRKFKRITKIDINEVAIIVKAYK
jgi:ubiquinone/menaquinone biosynthesis C-methylase UbiE